MHCLLLQGTVITQTTGVADSLHSTVANLRRYKSIKYYPDRSKFNKTIAKTTTGHFSSGHSVDTFNAERKMCNWSFAERFKWHMTKYRAASQRRYINGGSLSTPRITIRGGHRLVLRRRRGDRRFRSPDKWLSTVGHVTGAANAICGAPNGRWTWRHTPLPAGARPNPRRRQQVYQHPAEGSPRFIGPGQLVHGRKSWETGERGHQNLERGR